MPKARPVVCCETGERFESAVAAAAAIGCNTNNLRRALRTNTAARGRHWYYADQPQPAESSFKRRGASHCRPVVCWETGATYPSVTAAAEAAGCCTANIKRSAREGCRARGFHWYYADQPRPSKEQLAPPRSHVVVCRETGQVFSSIQEASRAVGSVKGSISDSLRTGCASAGFHWDSADPDGKVRTRPGRPVICVETGERYEKVADAIAAVEGNRIGICRALRNGVAHRGFHWRYADEEVGSDAD